MYCDSPDRLAARVFASLAGRAAGCPCCSFWRGALIGAVLVGIVTASLLKVFHA